MGIYRIQRLSYKTNNTHHTKKRFHQLLGVNWLNNCQSPSTKFYWMNPLTNQIPSTQNLTTYLKETTQSKMRL